MRWITRIAKDWSNRDVKPANVSVRRAAARWCQTLASSGRRRVTLDRTGSTLHASLYGPGTSLGRTWTPDRPVRPGRYRLRCWLAVCHSTRRDNRPPSTAGQRAAAIVIACCPGFRRVEPALNARCASACRAICHCGEFVRRWTSTGAQAVATTHPMSPSVARIRPVW